MMALHHTVSGDFSTSKVFFHNVQMKHKVDTGAQAMKHTVPRAHIECVVKDIYLILFYRR